MGCIYKRGATWWVGRRHDWSGRLGLRARLLAQPDEQPDPDEPGGARTALTAGGR